MEQKGREVFIREFIRSAILQIKFKPEWIEKDYLVQLPRRASLVENKQIIPKKQIGVVKKPVPQARPVIKPRQDIQMIRPLKAHPNQSQAPKPTVLDVPIPIDKNNSPLLPKSGAKIVPILMDPLVRGIECPGKDKNLIINRAGIINPSPLQLNETEINEILNEISTESRIPLLSGVFKAVYKSILITAVISEFVGSRFIIEKRQKQLQNNIRR